MYETLITLYLITLAPVNQSVNYLPTSGSIWFMNNYGVNPIILSWCYTFFEVHVYILGNNNLKKQKQKRLEIKS